MNWINDTFGTDYSANVQWAIMGVIVLVALLIILWMFRKIFGGVGPRLARGRKARIGVIEAAVVDDTRRLLLVRRDHVEHLVLIGGTGDVVIESGIHDHAQPAPASAHSGHAHGAPATARPEPGIDQPAAPATAPQPQSPPASAAAAPALHEPRPAPDPAPAPSRAPVAAGPVTATAAVAAASLAVQPETTATGPTVPSSESDHQPPAPIIEEAEASTGHLIDRHQDAERPETTAESFEAESTADASSIAPQDPELAADLDEALAHAGAPDVESDASDARTEDEMQRLLDRLTERKS